MINLTPTHKGIGFEQKPHQVAAFFVCGMIGRFVQSPANGVPKRPTASSAHSRNNINTIVMVSISLYPEFLTLLNITPPKRPVIVSIAPMIIKSNNDQLTSLVNCIAINGIKSNSPTTRKILIIILKNKYKTYIFISSFL